MFIIKIYYALASKSLQTHIYRKFIIKMYNDILTSKSRVVRPGERPLRPNVIQTDPGVHSTWVKQSDQVHIPLFTTLSEQVCFPPNCSSKKCVWKRQYFRSKCDDVKNLWARRQQFAPQLTQSLQGCHLQIGSSFISSINSWCILHFSP